MEIGQKVKIGGVHYIIRKEYLDCFLAIDEFLNIFKRIPKLIKIK